MRSVISFVLLALAVSTSGQTCYEHVEKACLELGNQWDGKSYCSSLHGAFEGNSGNLHKLMADHFRDSFKFLMIANKFDKDSVHKMGFNKLFKDYSDKMWENGKDLLKYIIKRGGRVGQTASGFNLNSLSLAPGINNEISSLSVSLDMLKQRAEDTIKVHAESLKKGSEGSPRLFDPAISHFLEERFISPYTSDIREIAGHLNRLGQITRNEKSTGFGRHIYDKSLL